jgi:hypothetical protein
VERHIAGCKNPVQRLRTSRIEAISRVLAPFV